MYSKTKKFIYIDIWKTASRSLVKALSPFASQHPYSKKIINKVLKSFNFPEFYTFPGRHSKAIDYLNFFGEKTYNNYYKFTFVRNPFDIQVSLYHYMKMDKNHFQHELIKNLNFDQYIEWRCEKDPQLQKQFVVDYNNNVAVDFIGKYEQLNADFNIIINKFNLNTKLEHINKSQHLEYSEYYSKQSEKMILEVFNDDFELFNYKKSLN